MESIWIVVAFALGLLARQFGFPSLIGFLIGGFALSAYGFNSVPTLEHLSHLGIQLLLFTVGLKLRLKSVFRAEVFGGAAAHLFVTAAVLAPALFLLSALAWQSALLVAIALGFSSTVVAVKVLEEKLEQRAFHGRVAIGILIVQDLVAIGILSATAGEAPSIWALPLLGLPLLRPLFYRLIDLSGHEELLVLLGLALALVLGGAVFQALGLSAELGALVMGALLAEHPRAKELANSLWSLKEVFLVGFFLQIGLLGVPDTGTLLIGALLALLIPAKVALFFFVLLLFRLRARSSFLAALSLGNYSEFGLIVAHLGAQNGWLDEGWVVLMAITVALSFIISAPINRRAHDLYQRFESSLMRFESARRHPDDEPVALGSAQIAVVGMGRVGTGAYDFLRDRNERVVGLDSDPGKVELHISRGRRVLYADAEDPGFWHRLKLNNLKSIMLAIPDPEAKCIAARELRDAGFKGLISATTVFHEDESIIHEAGCDLTFNYFNEAGVGFAEHVWEAMHPESKPSA